MTADAAIIGKATTVAHPNIALVKYWGKRDRNLNVPVTGSLSVTLASFSTRTEVIFFEPGQPDRVELNGKEADSGTHLRVCRFLDLVRAEAGLDASVQVTTVNDFPTAVGLASSASAFAALALAACEAAQLSPSLTDLSILARRGSGSAARSIFGGFVEMRPGSRSDGLDTAAEALAPAHHWDLQVIVVITQPKPKPLSSTEGMVHTAKTSPYYPAWIESHESDLVAARQAVLDRDIDTLGNVAEHSALKMHGAALAARPGLLYWNGATVEVIRTVQSLRKSGLSVYFTVDAGPQVKVLCLPDALGTVIEALKELPGIHRILPSSVGEGANLSSESGSAPSSR